MSAPQEKNDDSLKRQIKRDMKRMLFCKIRADLLLETCNFQNVLRGYIQHLNIDRHFRRLKLLLSVFNVLRPIGLKTRTLSTKL